MNDPNEKPAPMGVSADAGEPIEPSWKPLFWFLGVLILLIGVGEVIFEYGVQGLGLVGEGIFYLVEGTEEFLEDFVEAAFELSARDAEKYTAWVTTPLKLLALFLLLAWIWRRIWHQSVPATNRWVKRQYLAVRLAWSGLRWYWKVLAAVGLVGSLFLFI